MTPIDGTTILTADQMRAAEARAMASGASVNSLMRTAGRAVATAVARLAGDADILIACGPGNNGGDGYVAATVLAAMGRAVRVAALSEPRSDAARAACTAWTGPVEALHDAPPAAVLVDAVFGTGLARALAPDLAATLARLAASARLTIAVDLPSGVATDTGLILGEGPHAAVAADVTLALGRLKPAHLLVPAAERCGAVRLLDIGLAAAVDVDGSLRAAARPSFLAAPSFAAHKYTRGMVAVVAGAMPGAAELSAEAALRAGAGYVLLLGETRTTVPHAIVRRPFSAEALADERIGVIVIGPGLGRDAAGRERLDAVLATNAALLIDGDALHLLDEPRLAAVRARTAPTILTPHEGEFDKLFGKSDDPRIDRARSAAQSADAIVVFKGSSTIVAAPDRSGIVTPPANPWLSTAGTGDVLTGAIAAVVAAHATASVALLDRVAAGVWLHSEAARRLGGAFLADDLAHALSGARAAV
ncbi:bifunctional ADP-dependent NAD(P)H-hydrate dehydratase/NAD(P)H-hydrate epimerase [Sphingomonas sp. PAMC 26617]|uniref:bifunctional ADP-dependent NAD(P)H-hydrate dehydratase/NAD(P)H-hydrate epimerase n=1 Tax=Sphingomonas sp. PAMC 26617 TaxID=1112216 RepID=UPI00028826D9|nr:bifunctional ADP-dependent NAD(P)H-hydrate dehydratase/NAD(P)H-hydrate epimerase [Sphingomonas sp. PAMC 26617]